MKSEWRKKVQSLWWKIFNTQITRREKSFILILEQFWHSECVKIDKEEKKNIIETMKKRLRTFFSFFFFIFLIHDNGNSQASDIKFQLGESFIISWEIITNYYHHVSVEFKYLSREMIPIFFCNRNSPIRWVGNFVENFFIFSHLITCQQLTRTNIHVRQLICRFE